MADWSKAVPYVLKYEGGISKNTNDSASSRPVPDGTGNHTNKGVTWGVFVDNAPKLGYKATPDLFYKMPKDIWEKIFKVLYWDNFIQGDKIKSQAIAILLVDWAYGSGSWAVKNLQQVLNRSFGFRLTVDGDMGPKTLNATNTVNQEKLLDLLQAERLDFIKQISVGNNATFYNGWVNDAKYVYEQSLKYVVPVASGALFFWFLG
jgi:lysozyme family protein